MLGNPFLAHKIRQNLQLKPGFFTGTAAGRPVSGG
jgi:hypothetical protein